jgi:glycerol-3-phosphate acyltransferase PlsY
MQWQVWFWAVLGYLIGSIPFGYIVAARHGVDITKVGSGNTGATNVYRVLGAKIGGIVALLDISKGFIPTIVALKVGGISLASVVGSATVLGHVFSIFLKFRGGKGIATSFGVGLVLCPVCTLLALLAWIAVVHLTEYVSLGSIVAYGVGMLCSFVVVGPPVSYAFLFLFLLVTIAHRDNIKRLLAGVERRTTPPWKKGR